MLIGSGDYRHTGEPVASIRGRMLVRGRNARLSLAADLDHAPATREIARRTLFDSWTVELEGGFDHEVEAGAHVLYAPGRTLWCEPLFTDEPRDVALARLRARQVPGTLATFEDNDGHAAKLAVYLEGADASGTAWGLLGFTIIDGQSALTEFYFDDPADVAWALRCWKSVRHECDLN